jgi:hypothetical protein
MHETRKELFGWKGDGYSVGQHASHKDLLEYLTSDDEEKWLRALCHASSNMSHTERRTAEVVATKQEWGTYNQSFYDIQVNFATLSCVNRLTAKHPLEIYRFLRDEIGSKRMQFIPDRFETRRLPTGPHPSAGPAAHATARHPRSPPRRSRPDLPG